MREGDRRGGDAYRAGGRVASASAAPGEDEQGPPGERAKRSETQRATVGAEWGVRVADIAGRVVLPGEGDGEFGAA